VILFEYLKFFKGFRLLFMVRLKTVLQHQPLFLFLLFSGTAHAQHTYKIEKTFKAPFHGDWKYPAVNPFSNKLYITHGNQVSILNKNTGDSIGIIPNTPGVEGVALAQKFGKGYATNSTNNTVTVFDLKSDRYIKQIPVGEKPNCIIYDGYSGKIIVSNYKGGTISVIDPKLDKVEETIEVGGNKVTGIVSDGNGNLFVNLADKHEVVWVNLSTYEVAMHWGLGTGKSPTGIAIDTKFNRLFSVCNKLLVIFDAEKAKIIDSIRIGDNPDGIIFDPVNKLIFTANGNGSISVISQISANDYALIDNIATKKGSNTITFDETTLSLYVPGADQEIVTKTSPKQSTLTKWIPSSFQVMVLDKEK
jgi:YVTN family beta-propeller protein